ncbi:DUF4079 domain-containing protein [Spirulina sp. CCNP1310]|uniref:DUF4079 domain-containing protein n=1 Tax=Spirulina sp. CCNP1310 TaxID=3110249 RepID=UPI002B209804|nr:DUF4079 domain-containing protein [Spirulina sp. CCNP1310]MEA5419299.1 DUF4079 domain-containing protein [Spirulina sp. CCNP1310]
MDLPSFLWLWRIAAWSMGLSLTAYGVLGLTGWGMWRGRGEGRSRPPWLRPLHLTLGFTLVALVLLLLTVGIVGTLGYYGTLGHSWHLGAGAGVVLLVLASAATGLNLYRLPQGRSLHITINSLLLVGFIAVSLSGWAVVQKYLPGASP